LGVLRRTPVLCAVAVVAGLAAPAGAAPDRRGRPPPGAAAAARRGIQLAEKGNCVDAVPLLEEAEARKHTPETAVALAGCLVVLGELVRAADLYDAMARERPQRTWTRRDRAAQRVAGQRDDEVEARVPKIVLEVGRADAPDLQVALDGRPVTDLGVPIRVSPDVKVIIEAFAEGFEPFREELVLAEGEERTVRIALAPAAAAADPAAPEPPRPAAAAEDWLGARFRGVLLPRFLMNLVADGGTTIFVPGGGLTYTRTGDHPDISLGVQYAAYAMGPTAFRPHGTPDTEWEIVESNLHTIIGTADLLWPVPLDDAGRVQLRVGAGVGVGIAFAGDLHRWQAYPPDGAAQDPQLWEKCRGPNDPAGTFRYCNQLDKDADRYGKAEPYWHEDGLRPLFFPWLSIPQVGLSVKPTATTALDLEVGATLNGLMTSLGMRVAL
jgi:hypothetical protein